MTKTQTDPVSGLRSTLWALKGTTVFDTEFAEALHGLEVETLRHAVATVTAKVEAREATAMKKFGYVDADLRVYLEGARYAVEIMAKELSMYPKLGELADLEETD